MILLHVAEGVQTMRVTTEGQVTIPAKVREILGITPETEVDFIEEGGKFYIAKRSSSDDISQNVGRFEKLRGIATVKMTTDEIMALTRDSE